MPLTEEGLADIIKIVTMFIKTTFKDSKKVYKIINYVIKCILQSWFLDITKIADF